MSGRVLVGIDGSEGSRLALAWAIAEAARRRSTVDVLHVWHAPLVVSPVGVPGKPWDLTEYHARAKRLLDEQTESAVETLGEGEMRSAGPPITAREREGAPATTLLDAAEGAELLVVGSRGMGGFAGLLLGSVSQQCLHHAPCPVAVVPSTWTPHDGNDLIVAGVDGSEPAMAALAWAAREAQLRGDRLAVVQTWSPPVPAGPYALQLDERDEAELARATIDIAHHSRAQVVDPVLDRARVEVRVLRGAAAPALIDAADGADLLVVGSRGHGGFTSLLLGSVSQACAQHAPCPVVVVRGSGTAP
jgi:nucleotide-binding universal stress UspA family protein